MHQPVEVDPAEFAPFGHHSCFKNILTIQLASPPEQQSRHLIRNETFGELRYDSASGHMTVRRTTDDNPEYLDAPEFVSIALTARCNLRCAHCYPTVYNSTLPHDVVNRLLHELAEMKVFSVALSGGEPLMHPQFDQIARLASGLGFRTLLFTNGTFVDADRALELKALGIHEANVSIDSAEAESHDSFRGRQGAFAKSVAAIKHLAGAGLSTWVTCTVSDAVDVDPLELTMLAADAGAHKLRFVEVVGAGQARNVGLAYDEQWIGKVDRVLEYLRTERGNDFREADYFDFRAAKNVIRSTTKYSPFGCGAGTLRVRITARGKVLACPFMEDDVPLGDGTMLSPDSILTSPFRDIWHGSAYLQAYRSGTWNVNGKCGTCSQQRDWCASGCRAEAFFATQRLDQSDPTCRYGAATATEPRGRTPSTARSTGTGPALPLLQITRRTRSNGDT